MALPQHVRQMAADAVTQSKTVRQIRLLPVNQIDAPLLTPTADARRVGGCALLEYLWRGNEVAMTKDGWERNDGR